MTELEALSDHFIVKMYEAIRQEVITDRAAGTRIAGISLRRRAEELREEIDRRGLFCAAIDWPDYLALGGET